MLPVTSGTKTRCCHRDLTTHCPDSGSGGAYAATLHQYADTQLQDVRYGKVVCVCLGERERERERERENAPLAGCTMWK